MREVKGKTFKQVIWAVQKASRLRWSTTEAGWNLRRLIETLKTVSQTFLRSLKRGHPSGHKTSQHYDWKIR